MPEIDVIAREGILRLCRDNLLTQAIERLAKQAMVSPQCAKCGRRLV